MNSSWRLFGNAAGSILYGRFHTALLETERAGTDTIVDVRDDYDQAVPVIDAAVGVAWNRGPWETRGGYELANWFNLADRSAFVDSTHEGAYSPQSRDVLLDGLFVRFSSPPSWLAIGTTSSIPTSSNHDTRLDVIECRFL